MSGKLFLYNWFQSTPLREGRLDLVGKDGRLIPTHVGNAR